MCTVLYIYSSLCSRIYKQSTVGHVKVIWLVSWPVCVI